MNTYAPHDYEIELASGAYLDLSDPDPAKITLRDVAIGLSNTCRYAGQTVRFYSVAEHAIRVAFKLREEGASVPVQLAGLHHDDAEAFVGDVARPLKTLVPEFAQVEERVQGAVIAALDLPAHLWDDGARDMVKAVDDWALSMEAHHLMPSQGVGWWCEGIYEPSRKHRPALGWQPMMAEVEFQHLHRTLVTEIERCAA